MRKIVFESKVLPDGHLQCPTELLQKKNVHFKVIVTFDEADIEASDNEVELSATNDVSDDFLSDEELNHYLNLE